MDKDKLINILLGVGIGLVVGLVAAYLVFSASDKKVTESLAASAINGSQETCYTIQNILDKVKLNVDDEEFNESVKEINTNIRVCLSKDYADKLEESLKDIDLSEYDSMEEISEALFGGIETLPVDSIN